MESPWTKSPRAILEHFGVDTTRGLTSDQAARHAELYGKNGKSLHLLDWCRVLKCLYICRTSGRRIYPSVAIDSGTVQGPISPHFTRFCRHFFRLGSPRGFRRDQLWRGICGTFGHPSHPRGECDCWCHSRNKCREGN